MGNCLLDVNSRHPTLSQQTDVLWRSIGNMAIPGAMRSALDAPLVTLHDSCSEEEDTEEGIVLHATLFSFLSLGWMPLAPHVYTACPHALHSCPSKFTNTGPRGRPQTFYPCP